MKTKLKNNRFIEGFNFEHAFRSRMYGASGISHSVKLIYQGKTSEIPEELAKECVESSPHPIMPVDYYKHYPHLNWYVKTAKESIQSALTKEDNTIYPYCIIYDDTNSTPDKS